MELIEKIEEIKFKTCKTCYLQKELNRFRPSANHCKNCANKKDAANKLKRNIRFYENHKERLQEENLLNYYKRIYDNKNLTKDEVNILRILI